MKEHQNSPEQLPVIILAAGLSSRMGVPKPFLKWDKHITFLEKIAATYSSFEAGQINIVLNSEGYKYIRNNIPQIAEYSEIIINKHPERGRFSSLKLGLQNIYANTACYIQNTDNPFVTEELLGLMDNLTKPDTYVVPVYKGKGGHPILVGAEIIKSLLLLDNTDYDLRELLNAYKKTETETTDMNILVNINSKEDYHNYFKHII
ncbi:MAG: NTP transferase domain-containing protein [Bacteroidales bacterium]|jgi:molybdenum cofactor cytidylyltransferase